MYADAEVAEGMGWLAKIDPWRWSDKMPIDQLMKNLSETADKVRPIRLHLSGVYTEDANQALAIERLQATQAVSYIVRQTAEREKLPAEEIPVFASALAEKIYQEQKGPFLECPEYKVHIGQESDEEQHIKYGICKKDVSDNGSNIPHIFVAFRGTHEIMDWFANVAFELHTPESWSKEHEVHANFWKKLQEVMLPLGRSVKMEMEGVPDYRVVLLGHSQGGGLAMLLHAYLFQHPECSDKPWLEALRPGGREGSRQCICFAAPMVMSWNGETPKYLERSSTNYVLGFDPVPRMYGHDVLKNVVKKVGPRFAKAHRLLSKIPHRCAWIALDIIKIAGLGGLTSRLAGLSLAVMVQRLQSHANVLRNLGHELALGKLHSICDKYRHFCTIVPLAPGEGSQRRLNPCAWEDELTPYKVNFDHHKIVNYIHAIAQDSQNAPPPPTAEVGASSCLTRLVWEGCKMDENLQKLAQSGEVKVPEEQRQAMFKEKIHEMLDMAKYAAYDDFFTLLDEAKGRGMADLAHMVIDGRWSAMQFVFMGAEELGCSLGQTESASNGPESSLSIQWVRKILEEFGS